MIAMNNEQPALFDAPEPTAPPAYSTEDFPFFFGAKSLASRGFIAADWVSTLEPLDGVLQEIARKLAARSQAGEQILPAPEVMLRALSLPVAEIKVLIMGQDPYPTPGQANGLAFAAAKNVRPLPRSLRNIYKELFVDLGVPEAGHPDLGAWHEQGVMLLNQVLSVTASNAGSHQKLGWAPVVEAIIATLNARKVPVVAVLWGAHAQKLGTLMNNMPQLRSAHPSPLSASRGFFGSKHFSQINRRLAEIGQAPIEWKLPAG